VTKIERILEAIPADFMGPTPNSLYLLSKDWTLLVVGSRESRFEDPSGSKLVFFDFFKDYLLDAIVPPSLVISGDSPEKGVDAWIREFCEENHIPFKGYPPDFEKWGEPNAYYQRNQAMADDCNQALGFMAFSAPLNRSGTMQTMRMARRQHKSCTLYRFTSKGIIEETMKY